MPTGPDPSTTQSEDRPDVGPTDAEIEEWAANERKRREAWLHGPTESDKATWARREYERRMSEGGMRWLPRRSGESARAMQRYVRELQLATEGAMSMLFHMSLSDAFENLVEAGRQWEDEFSSAPPRRRRVALESEPGSGTSASGTIRMPPPEGPASSS